MIKKTLKKVRVKQKDKHKTELRDFTYKRSYCTQPSCKFFGKEARQGICFSTEPEILDMQKLADTELRIRAETTDILRKEKNDKRRIEWLRAMYECAMLNWSCGLDDLVRLRRDNALLTHALERAKKRKK